MSRFEKWPKIHQQWIKMTNDCIMNSSEISTLHLHQIQFGRYYNCTVFSTALRIKEFNAQSSCILCVYVLYNFPKFFKYLRKIDLPKLILWRLHRYPYECRCFSILQIFSTYIHYAAKTSLVLYMLSVSFYRRKKLQINFFIL